MRKFDSALGHIKQISSERNTTQKYNETNDILAVLKPIKKKLLGQNSNTLILNEDAVTAALNQSHQDDWQQFKNGLINLVEKLEGEHQSFSEYDVMILEDVADALDMECASLFRQMSGRA